MKNIILILLLSPYLLSESYSCTNEVQNAEPWNKQVVFKRNGDEFTSTKHNALSIINSAMGMSVFNWEIYAEDTRGIFLISQNGLIRRERGDHGRDEHSQYMDVAYLNKRANKSSYTEFDMNIIDGFKNIITGKGSCLMIED